MISIKPNSNPRKYLRMKSVSLNIRLVSRILSLAFALAVVAACKQSGGNEDTSTASQNTPVETEDGGFVEILDGRTLTNWVGDTTYWSVRDGNLSDQITSATI